MGINALVNTLAHLRLMDAAANTAGAGIGNDYKALVCIFLRGGCDMNKCRNSYRRESASLGLSNGSWGCGGARSADYEHQVERPFGCRSAIRIASELQQHGVDVQRRGIGFRQ